MIAIEFQITNPQDETHKQRNTGPLHLVAL